MLCQQSLLPLAHYNICLTNQGEIYHAGFGGVVCGVSKHNTVGCSDVICTPLEMKHHSW